MLEAGVNYSAAGVLPVILSFLAVLIFSAAAGKRYTEYESYKYLTYLLPQLCFAGIALFFFRRNNQTLPAREVYAPCKWYYFLLAIGLSFGLFSLSELNVYFMRLLEMIGYHAPASTVPDVTGWYLVPGLAIIALLPAVFEETLFRGIQLGSMQKSGWNTAAALFISGAMFSLFHGNPAQTVYQFICGVCYGLLAVRSGSILPTMLAHFTNNAVILCLASAGYEEDIPQPAKLPLYLTAAVVLLGVLIFLVFFNRRGNRRGNLIGGKKYFLGAGVGILVCAIEWITALVGGIA